MEEKTLKEIIKEELGKLSKLSWRQRIGYIWDYYKPVLAGILGIIAVISIGVTIYHNMQLNYLLQVYMVNCNSINVDSEQLTADFAEYIGGVGAKDVITIDTSVSLTDDGSQYAMANQVKFTAMTSAHEVDVLIVDEEKYLELEAQGYFRDLRDILGEEQLEEWSEVLVEGTKTEDGTVPVTAIDLTNAPVLLAADAYPDAKVYGTVVVNSQRTELSDDFITFLMAE